ncbi:uncharacterized protein [Aegilops tauschii subsp. strangulata]|uniref:Speckle-type POZ protein-like protein n=1 Tax=Aegilops tauschii TaxID=37682 RepID=M8CVL4_AEGTA
MAHELLVAADLYDLERLRLMCEKLLSESIDIGNVMTTLMLAHDRRSCQQLEASCIEFLASDPDVYDTVEATEEYKELEKTCPSFINEITKKIAKSVVSRDRSLSFFFHPRWNCDGWGWGNFISAKSANSHYVGHDGSFTIQCQVKVHTESCTSSTMGVGTIIVVPPSNFAWHLEQLLVMEEGSDVKFLVEDSEIRAHGLVIATRSPVLHEAVESASGTDHVRIDGIRAMAFKAMLHFIYTDELPHVDDLVPADGDSTMMAGEMLAAACRFRLERMKRLCINLLAENVVTVLSALATVKLYRLLYAWMGYAQKIYNTGLAAAGVVARNVDGEVLFNAGWTLPDSSDAEEARGQAMLLGMQTLEEVYIGPPMSETDCEAVVEALNANSVIRPRW